MNIQELCHTGSPTQQQLAAAFGALGPVGVDMLVGLWEADPRVRGDARRAAVGRKRLVGSSIH